MNDLKKLDRRIADKEDAIASERENEDVILANLGQELDEANLPKLPSDTLEEVRRLSGEIRDAENSLRRILADNEKRTELQEEKKSLKVELRSMKNREESALEELGRAAWELWKSSRQFGDEMESALEDLIKTEKRLHEAEDAVYRYEGENKGRTAALFTRGKALLWAGRKKTASVALERLWGKAGLSIFDTMSAEAFTDTPAALPMATLKALQDRGKEIDDRLEAISAEFEALEASLEEMPGKGGAKKRVSYIESLLEQNRNTLDDAYRELGRTWIGMKPAASESAELKARRKELEAAENRIAGLEADISALKAHKEYLIAEADRDAKAEKAAVLEETVKEQQTALKAAKKELASAEKACLALKESLPPISEED
ncbi:MAG: hypothetical protein P1P77_01515 [Spirochaetaceae bacterium]|nr:hypothetical protein [Spirochaetaceae bacterium]